MKGKDAADDFLGVVLALSAQPASAQAHQRHLHPLPCRRPAPTPPTASSISGSASGSDGELPTASGGVQRQRISWTPRDDGSVTQRRETSDDAGASWQVVFLGVYRKRSTSPAD